MKLTSKCELVREKSFSSVIIPWTNEKLCISDLFLAEIGVSLPTPYIRQSLIGEGSIND